VIEATAQELAQMIGVSKATFWRLLKHKHAAKFITRLNTKRRYSNYRGGTVNEKNIWRVRLDDPLTPEDEARLQELLSKSQIETRY
jgi:DNA-binding Lrp family transcriptional regulator